MENFKCWSHLVKQCTSGTQRPISECFGTDQINPLTQGMAHFINQILCRKKGIQDLVNYQQCTHILHVTNNRNNKYIPQDLVSYIDQSQPIHNVVS